MGAETPEPRSVDRHLFRGCYRGCNVYGVEEEIPYWRIVGERGAVRGDKMIEQNVQEEKLTAEGHTFEATGHDRFAGIKVTDYKAKLV